MHRIIRIQSCKRRPTPELVPSLYPSDVADRLGMEVVESAKIGDGDGKQSFNVTVCRPRDNCRNWTVGPLIPTHSPYLITRAAQLKSSARRYSGEFDRTQTPLYGSCNYMRDFSSRWGLVILRVLIRQRSTMDSVVDITSRISTGISLINANKPTLDLDEPQGSADRYTRSFASK